MKKPVSLVLSSGGARGIAHIGVIEVLEEHGYEIKSIAGTSMGALVGGMFAAGNLNVFKDWICSITPRKMIRLVDFTLSMDGLLKGKKIISEIEKLVPDRNIEDMRIPFIAVSTDIVNNKEIIHDKGSLYQAIRGSISIPSIFKPLDNGSSLLIDGGIMNPTPINRVKRVDNDILVAVNVGSYQYQETTGKSTSNLNDGDSFKIQSNSLIPIINPWKPSHLNLVNKSIALMLNQISELTIEKYNPDIVIKIDHDAFGTYEFYKAEEIIGLGRSVAEEKIKAYESFSVNEG